MGSLSLLIRYEKIKLIRQLIYSKWFVKYYKIVNTLRCFASILNTFVAYHVAT